VYQIQAHHIPKNKLDSTVEERDNNQQPRLSWRFLFHNIFYFDFSQTKIDLANPSSQIVKGGEKNNLSEKQPNTKVDARYIVVGVCCLL
jgi:hypothetical protein